MKIAIIVRSLKYGGMERAACNQADSFYQSGYNVDLIYFSNKDRVLSPKENGVKVIHIDLHKLMKQTIFGKIWNILAKLSNMLIRRTYPLVKGFHTSDIFKQEFNKLEKVEKYDLILIRGQGTYEQIWTFKDARSVRICVNVSKKTYSTFIDKLMSKCYYENVRVNCNSNGSKDFYIEKFKRENIVPISLNAIKNPFFKERVIKLSEEINNDIPNEPYIIGVGRLVKTKNFELLIDSYYKLIKDYGVKHKLVIVGDGDDKIFLENKCKVLGISNNVLFTGYQSNPFTWIKNSDIIVFTSKIEGLSNVLIEAMCCKTRILITKSPGGMIEMMIGKLQDNIADNNPDDIANKIKLILSKDKSFYYEDYESALMAFDPKSVVNQWLNMYVINQPNKEIYDNQTR